MKQPKKKKKILPLNKNQLVTLQTCQRVISDLLAEARSALRDTETYQKLMNDILYNQTNEK